MNDDVLPYKNGTSKWQLITSVITVLIIMIGSLITFFVQIATLSAQVGINTTKLVNIENQISLLNDKTAGLRSEMSVQVSNLKEIETQFCATDIVRNLNYSSEQRLVALLWKKVFKVTLPTDNTYYPQVCNRTPTKVAE